MTNMRVFTTDKTFVDDLNAAKLQGVEATYDPTMAYDSVGTDQISEIVISFATSVGAGLLTDWILARLKKSPPKRLEINNQTINADNVVIVINNIQVQNKKPNTAQHDG